MTRNIFHRGFVAFLGTSLAFTLAACASTPTPGSDAHSSGSEGQAAGAAEASDTITYERKRGEALEPLLEEWATGDQHIDSSGIALPLTAVFHDVRGGEHPDFYRVIVEFKRDAQVGTRPEGDTLAVNAHWTDKAIGLGKETALENSGKTFLDVAIDNTTMPAGDQEKLYYAGEKNLTFGPIDVSIDGTFEKTTHVVIGMDKEREYQMSFLEGPTRLVIDVKK